MRTRRNGLVWRLALAWLKPLLRNCLPSGQALHPRHCPLNPRPPARRWKQLWPAAPPRQRRAIIPTVRAAPSVAIRAARFLSPRQIACPPLPWPICPPEPSACQLPTQNKSFRLIPIPGRDFCYYSSLSPFPGANSPSSVRRCWSARCSLDLIVPSRLPNVCAIWGTVSPEKNRSVNTVLCSSESA